MPIKVGLQMHSVREAMHLDPLGAVERCAQAGFRYLELPASLKNDKPGLLFGKSPAQWVEAAKTAHAVLIGGYAKPDPATAEAAVDFYAALGAQRVVIPIDYFPTRKALDEKCEFYNRLGKLCAARGLRLFYENHYHEWQMIDGQTILERLMTATDPTLFTVSLNTYWLMRGLVDPGEVFKQFGNRLGSIVQQDYPLSEIDKFNMWHFDRYHPIAKNIQYESVLQGSEIENIHPVQCELFCEIGDGVLPLQRTVDAVAELGTVEYVLLKQDYTRMPDEFDSVSRSAHNYHRMRGVCWD
ncbi:MAG: sugar phosphate isomerase/epimerase [Oscillospiraceae bacterium]